MRFLKWLVVIFLAFGLVLGGAFVTAGLLMRAERTFTNEIEINAPTETVWQVLTDKGRYAEWQDKVEKVEAIDDKNWVEYAKGAPAPLKFSIVSDERPQKMEFHYTMGESYDGRWIGEITPTANGVKLKTIDSNHAKDWFTKIFTGLFFDLDSFGKEWNSKLKQRVENVK